MNAIILPYKNGSRSGAALANALGVRQIRLAGSTIHRQRSKTIINWGNSGRTLPPQGLGSGHYTLNPTVLVEIAANKLSTFESLLGNTRIPEYTTDYETACEWLDEGCTVVERHQLTGHSGAGVEIVEDVEELSADCPLYVQYVKKQDEYRIHIMGGQVIDVQRKARRSDVPDEDVNWQVRNHQNGFCYMRENVNPDTDVIVQALNAIESLGLDFGAVDVIWNAHQNKAYVLEVNTACGLEGTTLERYKVAFQELLMTGEVTPLEGYEYEMEEGEEDHEGVPLEGSTPLMPDQASGDGFIAPVQEAARELQVGDRVMISTTSEYYTQTAHNPAGVPGTVSALRDGNSLPFSVQWDNGCRNSYSPSDLVFMGEEDNTVEETAPRQELTPETLRVGMRLRALQERFFGARIAAGDIVEVTRVDGSFFYARSERLGLAWGFTAEHLNGEYFELVDDGVVQEEQEVVQTGVEEVEYTSEYPRHHDENFPIGCAVEVLHMGNIYPHIRWARTRASSVGAGETGVVVGCSCSMFNERTILAVKDNHGEIFVIAAQGVRRVGTSTTSVTQTSSDITPSRAPLSKWLVVVIVNFKFCEITFSMAISLHTIPDTIIELRALVHGAFHKWIMQ